MKINKTPIQLLQSTESSPIEDTISGFEAVITQLNERGILIEVLDRMNIKQWLILFKAVRTVEGMS